MPSSGYTAISFTAGEQPTTAKWNLVGSNDASFNNGNGFNDSIIINRHLAASAALTPNVRLTTIASSFAVQGSRFTTTSTTFTDITAMSFTYTSGSQNERLLLWAFAMAAGASGQNLQWTLNINGTDQTERAYHDGAFGVLYTRQGQFYTYDVAANTTITIKFRALVTGGTGAFVTDNVAWMPTINGFAISNV